MEPQMRRLTPLVLAFLAACATASSTGAPPPSSGRMVVRDETSTGGAAAEAELDIDRRSVDGMVAANADQVWAALPSVYRALGIERAGVMDANPAQRTYGRQYMRLYRKLGNRTLSTYIECGNTYAGDADTYDITMSVSTQVVPAGDRTQLHSWVEANGRQQASSSTPVRCMSKGTLERAITTMLNDSVGVHTVH
jgi:hypothetical protein